jgi:hypothetical protein
MTIERRESQWVGRGISKGDKAKLRLMTHQAATRWAGSKWIFSGSGVFNRKGTGWSSVVEHLPSRLLALNSISITAKRKKRKKGDWEARRTLKVRGAGQRQMGEGHLPVTEEHCKGQGHLGWRCSEWCEESEWHWGTPRLRLLVATEEEGLGGGYCILMFSSLGSLVFLHSGPQFPTKSRAPSPPLPFHLQCSRIWKGLPYR